MSFPPRLCSSKSYSQNRKARTVIWRGREAVQKNGSANRCAVTLLASAIKPALFALPSLLIHTFQSHSTKVAFCPQHDCGLAVCSKTNDDFKMCSKDTHHRNMFLWGRITARTGKGEPHEINCARAVNKRVRLALMCYAEKRLLLRLG